MANTVPSQTFLNLTIPASTRDYLGYADLSGGSWTIEGLDSRDYNFYEVKMIGCGSASNPAYFYLQLGDGAAGSVTWRTDSNYHSHYREASSANSHSASSQTYWGQAGAHMSIGYQGTTPSMNLHLTFSGHLNLLDGSANAYPFYWFEGSNWRNTAGLTPNIQYRASGTYVGSETYYTAIRWVYQSASFNGGTLHYWGVK